MPTSQISRVNPLDLQGNIAIGVSLPFNGPAGPFNSTYSTKDQIKSNLINLLLTNKGERIMNPEFGADLGKALFEGITDDIKEDIKSLNIEKIDIDVFKANFKKTFKKSDDPNKVLLQKLSLLGKFTTIQSNSDPTNIQHNLKLLEIITFFSSA